MTPDTNHLVCERLALDDLQKSFNDIASRHALDATEAALVVLNFSAAMLANQYQRGENKKAFRNKIETTMEHLLKFYMPRILNLTSR